LEDGGNNMGEMNCEKMKVVVSFIWQHPAPLAIFHRYETNLMLLDPTKTQFTTNFLMVERLFKFKFAIEQIITNPKCTTFVNALHGNHC
jgi:hypothetical protein